MRAGLMELDGHTTEVLIDAICTYGDDAQVTKAIEEMAELTQALCKALASPVTDEALMSHVLEELADVQITTAELTLMFDDDGGSGLDDRIAYKVSRLEDRIREGKEV